MPIWRRNHPADPTPPPPWTPPAAVPRYEGTTLVGTEPCRRRRCHAVDGIFCAYVDRRGRGCHTAWCAEHRTVLDGKVYCQRHASTLAAIGPAAIATGSLPELNDRIPSLVHWVSADVDQDVQTLLVSHQAAHPGSHIVVDPVTLITGGGRTQDRRWEHNWKLVNHTGILLKVTIQVLEVGAVVVVLRVGQQTMARSVPPWIQARIDGVEVSTEDDLRQRRIYYTELHNAIAAGLLEEDAR